MVKKKDVSVRMAFKKVKIDERTKDYIEKRMRKIERLTKKFTKLEYETEIRRDKKGKFTAELMLKTPYELYRSEEISESIEGSVDMAVESLKNQIVKSKEKLKELRERGARSIKKKAVIDGNARFRK